MVKAVVFDVNETLLELSALDVIFKHDFRDGDGSALREEWFLHALQSALTATLLGRHLGFEAHGMAALEMLAKRHAVSLTDATCNALKEGMKTLPPHPDTLPSLKCLRQAGFKVAALTNNALSVLEEQMENAGLKEHFDLLLSADSVRKLKPASEAYHYAAERLRLPPDEILLVAAHSWDVAGALHAGLNAAFVERPGRPWDPTMEKPSVADTSLVGVIDKVLFKDSQCSP